MKESDKVLRDIDAMLKEAAAFWTPPVIEDTTTIPTGDMPGDKVVITRSHIDKADVIFPELINKLTRVMAETPNKKAVISVHGGSGVGKSETASLLAHYLRKIGLGSYVMSGDNYPFRIPKHNDAERERVFRYSGLKALVDAGRMNSDIKVTLKELWLQEKDADPTLVSKYPWLKLYQLKGREALSEYLGGPMEINFSEVNDIIRSFKSGMDAIMLKRMGRVTEELWYYSVDFSAVDVLVIEWTHGNNDNLEGVDIPILLNSTPAETLKHRMSRNRDGKTDSPFVTTVLELEQEKLKAQAATAEIILTKTCELIDYDRFLEIMNEGDVGNGPMLNAYPDSVGGRLEDILQLLGDENVANTFESFYILPSIYNSDLDRGFSVIDYDINQAYGGEGDLRKLKELGIDLKLDFVLNHASVLSHQFQDIIRNGRSSEYVDFFIDWNKFWQGCGEIGEGGYIIPEEKYLKDMFFRKPGLPILSVRMPDGEEVPYWNTFYQSVDYDRVDAQDIMRAMRIQYTGAQNLAEVINKGLDDGKSPKAMDLGIYEDYREPVVELLESNRKYLGQMDLNIQSPMVWDYYDDTLRKLSSYGAKIVRLDAFAYAPKEPGKRNFLNEPETWELLAKVKKLADRYQLQLLPEIHSKYEENIHGQIADQGYMIYDFFLPGLLIDAMERRTWTVLKIWIDEILTQGMRPVNMLGCHDGIPLLDLKGLLEEDQIQNLINVVVDRGGYVKDLHGKKNMYYQVNATYFSALGEDDRKMLLARAVQMFMPGKPQVWYLDLFAGRNDHEAVKRAGAGGHKEINRTNLSMEEAMAKLNDSIVQEQLSLIRFRNTHPAFKDNAKVSVDDSEDTVLKITWENGSDRAELTADIAKCSYSVSAT